MYLFSKYAYKVYKGDVFLGVKISHLSNEIMLHELLQQ